jgi:glutathione peroxidase-family protein
MYSKTFNISRSEITLQDPTIVNQTLQEGNLIGDSTVSNTSTSIETVSERGYQKIKEMYAIYKQKGLIPLDFPELTVAEMAYKLQHLEQDILDAFKGKADMQPLTDATTYGKYLTDYYNKIRGQQTSWFIRYVNPNPYILKDGGIVFAFKTELDPQQREQALTELRADITSFNTRLNENRTFGEVRGEKNLKIDNSITINSIVTTLDPSQVDFQTTLRQQFGILNPT